MHECPICYQACTCDIDDCWFEEAPNDCRCALSCAQADLEEQDSWPAPDEPDDDDYCALCGAYLDGEGNEANARDATHPHLCAECGEDVDDGPYALPDVEDNPFHGA